MLVTFEFGWEITKTATRKKETIGEISVPFSMVTPGSALMLVCLSFCSMLPAFG